MEIDAFKLYRATVRLRRGEGWDVKPESEQMDGKEIMLKPLWFIVEDESSLYPGEWAMGPAHFDDWPDDAPDWIASGDLENLREA